MKFLLAAVTLLLAVAVCHAAPAAENEEQHHTAAVLPPKAPADGENVKSYQVYRERALARLHKDPLSRYSSVHRDSWIRHCELNSNLLRLSPLEHDIRYEIFSDRVDQIVANNAQHGSGQVQFVQDYDHPFMHLTTEEFEEKHAGLKLTRQHVEKVAEAAALARKKRQATQAKKLPKSLDWDAQGKVTPGKNQGECGSCWAFAVNAVLESLYLIKSSRRLC